MATLLRTTGEILQLNDLSLAALQLAVGGFIEGITTYDDRIMYINEEGELLGLPINQYATELTKFWYEAIFGDVVILTPEETQAESG